MIQHFCTLFYALFDSLKNEIDELQQSKKPHSYLSQKEKERLDHTLLEGLERALWTMDRPREDDTPDTSIRFQIALVRHRLERNEKISRAVMVELLRPIFTNLYLKFSDLKFAYIPPPNDKYFEHEHLFGLKVYDNISEARDEIKDVGNAFAAGLYTACVFHLTRVLEHGLRAIANAMGVTITDKKQPIPLEYGDWHKVLEQIDGKIKQARLLPNNAIKSELIKRYSEASERLSWAKDQWRNDIAHTRTRFSEDEAKGILDRVRGLMEFLGNTLEMQW